MSTIPFDEIVPGATARLAVIDDTQYLSIRDVLMHICGLTSKRANEKWERLSDEVKNELTAFCGQFRFPGPGNPSPTPVITFKGVLKLIMLVSGEKAALYRSAMVKILQRYYAGDGSLTEEIESNAKSTSPIAQLARASMHASPAAVVSAEELAEKKRKREIEDTELHCKKLGNVKLFADTMALINPRWSEDARLRMQTEDWLKNVAFNSQLALTNGGGNGGALANGEDYRSITIGEVAHDMGKRLDHGQSIRVGSLVARKYQEKYGVSPPKQKRWVDNAERNVCAYTEKDRGIIVEALKELGMV